MVSLRQWPGRGSAVDYWREIATYTKKVHEQGYMRSHGGNLSVRDGGWYTGARNGHPAPFE